MSRVSEKTGAARGHDGKCKNCRNLLIGRSSAFSREVYARRCREILRKIIPVDDVGH